MLVKIISARINGHVLHSCGGGAETVGAHAPPSRCRCGPVRVAVVALSDIL